MPLHRLKLPVHTRTGNLRRGQQARPCLRWTKPLKSTPASGLHEGLSGLFASVKDSKLICSKCVINMEKLRLRELRELVLEHARLHSRAPQAPRPWEVSELRAG